MFKQNKLQIFSFRKVKGYGLASAVIASMFLAQGVVSADVVTTPDGTKTTLSNDKASVTVDANHFKDSNDKSAKELYDAKEYEADKVTTGKDTVTDESKTVVSFETEDGTKLKENVTKTTTEEKELNYKVEGTSGKEYTGADTTTSTVTAELEKQNTIEKDGEKYKYVRTETTQGKETVLTETNFNDVETKASVEGMHNEDGSIKYDKIKDGSRVWVLEEKEDGTYGNYALIENAQGLSDEKIQEAAKTATTKFSKAEVEKLGGIKETDSIVVYETNTYAARKKSSTQYGKDFYYSFTANSNKFYKSYIDEIYKVGLEGLEKQGDKYVYKGQEVSTIEDFKTIQKQAIDGQHNYYPTDESNKHYLKSYGTYAVRPTYYDVLSDFLIAHPDSPILTGKAKDVFWNTDEEYYFNIAFVARLLNESLKSKYNLNINTPNFSDKHLNSKVEDARPTEKTTYSFSRTELDGDADSFLTSLYNTDNDMWKHEIGLSYSTENVDKVRRFVKGYRTMNSDSASDVFNDKPTSEITQQDYVEAVFNNVFNFYLSTYKNQFTREQIKELRARFGDSVINIINNNVEWDVNMEPSPDYVMGGHGSELYRNSLGVVTENTESFTYHDVITPLRAYRLTADNNLVRHIYEQVKRGSVVATYSDEEGNKLADDVNVKTNEYEGEDYQTEAKTIRPIYEYDKVNGLTKTTITRYELIKTPDNANGKVVAETTITVPYVYRKVVTVDIKGSVIATYKDEEGNILASEEKVITNQNAGTYYAAASKLIQAATSSQETEHGRKVTVITYELIKTPDNETGEVVGGETLVVPYVYRKVVTVKSDGGVVATHKDTEGNDLAPKEVIKSHAPNGEAYTTSAKEIPNKVVTDKTVKGLTRVTTTRYELVENPSNKDGNVVGGETITVPYVYKPVKSVQINGSVIATYTTEDGEKLADDVAVKTDAPSSEAYTTERKTFDSVTKEYKVNGFTRVTTTHYELIETPTNADGQVKANKIITVPYVYRKVVTETIKGSVIATYKDEEGTILASEEKVITNQNAGTYYAAAAKTIQASASSKVTENGREVTLITYELIKTPDNETGEVVGGETLVVPYVYRKVVTNKLVPNNPPVVEDETIKVTRFHSDTGEELQSDVTGFEDAPKTIGDYQFTGKTEMNEGNDVQTHIYTKIVTEIPNEAPKVELEEAKVTRFHSDKGEELQSDITGFEDAPKTIGNYQFTGTTKINEGNDVQTHIYTKIVTEIPNEAPKVDVPEAKVTRFHSDSGEELQSDVTGFEDAPKTIGDYQFTGKTEMNDGNDVQTHIYTKIVTEIPNEAPKVEKDELKLTRFMLEDRKTEIKDMVEGFVKPIEKIGDYTYTGVTDSDEGGAVITHIYKLVETEVPNVSELPKDSPVYDKPEFNGGVIPNDPPIHDKPEYNGGVVPNDPPVHDKPEYNGGVVPNDSPVHDKPKLDIPTPEVPTPTPTPELPKPETPSVETPKPSQPLEQKPQEKYVTKELPNTGGSESSALGLLGFAGVMGSLLLLKKQKED